MKTRYSLLALGALLALSQAAMAQRGSSGHVNVIYWQAPSILNPYLSGGTKDLEASSLILDPLVKFNEKGEMVYKVIETTLGRILFNQAVPASVGYINKMLGKKSGLSYYDVRERYEHFRARCTQDKPKIFDFNKLTEKEKKKEKGCTEPLYGKKSKCIIKIVPQEEKIDTFQMDSKCLKKKDD